MCSTIIKRMKKISVLFVVFFQAITISAQPNGGFEDWITEFSYETPEHWQTLNFLSLTTPPNPLSAFKAIGADKHSGNYALKLKSVFLNQNPLPDSIMQAFEMADTVGLAFTGKIYLSPLSFEEGFTYTSRPEKLQFWAKYAPVGGDSAVVYAYLKKWNGNTSDTVAFGNKAISATPVYTFFEMPVNYRSNELPDSAFIGFLSSKDHVSARVNSTLFVDDVAFTGWVGLDEDKPEDRVAKVFPNPARNTVTIYASSEGAEIINLRDISGRIVFSGNLQDKKTSINTDLFSQGVYFYEILDNNNKVLYRDRFNVTK